MFKKLQTAIAAGLLLSIPQTMFAQSPDLGSVESFAVFTSVGAFNSISTTSITGDIGTNAGAFSGFPPGVVFGAIENENAVSAAAMEDLTSLYDDLSTRTCDFVLSVTLGGGDILTSGNYCTGAATTLTGEIILDGAGDPNAEFIIQMDGAFSVAANSMVTLINGASACNVYWQVNGAVEIGDNASFAGNIVAHGAISMLVTSSLNGRALSTAGAISLNANTIQVPGSTNYYADMDGDSYGDIDNMVTSCSMPAGYVNNALDCDDTNNMVNPMAVEICNLLDDDCNGLTDDLDFTANIYPTDTAFSCKSFDFTFSTDSCVGCTYQWFKNDNIIIGANESTYSTTKPAYYSVEVTLAGGCSTTTNHTLLHMNQNPNANIYQPNGLNICAPTPGENIILKVGYVETNTYKWFHNDIVYTGEGANSWRIFPTSVGTYFCEITTVDGCMRNTNSRNVTNACKTGSSLENSIAIYPNPANDEINITVATTDLSKEATLQIVSLLGEIVYTENCTITNNNLNKNISIDLLPAGMYTVSVIFNTEVYSMQLIKQ